MILPPRLKPGWVRDGYINLRQNIGRKQTFENSFLVQLSAWLNFTALRFSIWRSSGKPHREPVSGRHAGCRFLCGLAGWTAIVSFAQAQEAGFDPANLDLAKLIECRAQVPDYNELASWLKTQPQALERLGWQQVASANPFLEQYLLEKPVNVFGVQTSDIAFAGSAILAVLDGDTASVLAGKLGVSPILDSSDKFMGTRVIAEETDDSNEMITIKTRVSLNVSTVESHPGKVFAGCSYNFSLDVKE